MNPKQRKIIIYKTKGGKAPFVQWIEGLKDLKMRAIVKKRLDRVEEGLLGDTRYVGSGVFELRFDYGPGYRVYYGQTENVIVVLLCAGDKRSQKKDIQKAQEYWINYRGS